VIASRVSSETDYYRICDVSS